MYILWSVGLCSWTSIQLHADNKLLLLPEKLGSIRWKLLPLRRTHGYMLKRKGKKKNPIAVQNYNIHQKRSLHWLCYWSSSTSVGQGRSPYFKHNPVHFLWTQHLDSLSVSDTHIFPCKIIFVITVFNFNPISKSR